MNQVFVLDTDKRPLTPCHPARAKAGRIKRVRGFQTGDLVRLERLKGKYAGIHEGRLARVRARGDFDISSLVGIITAKYNHYTLVQRGDGYAYVL